MIKSILPWMSKPLVLYHYWCSSGCTMIVFAEREGGVLTWHIVKNKLTVHARSVCKRYSSLKELSILSVLVDANVHEPSGCYHVDVE